MICQVGMTPKAMEEADCWNAYSTHVPCRHASQDLEPFAARRLLMGESLDLSGTGITSLERHAASRK